MNTQDWDPVILNKINKQQLNTNLTSPLIDKEDIEPIAKISLSNSLLIQKARLNMKLSQTVLANKINIDVNVFKKYESGKITPAFNILIKLEKALNIKLNKKKIQ